MRTLLTVAARAEPATTVEDVRSFLPAQAFTCSGRACGQMPSCAACHALLACGDRDRDGIPREPICSRPCR